jgi:L,D-transpeptidase catalytic domain
MIKFLVTVLVALCSASPALAALDDARETQTPGFAIAHVTRPVSLRARPDGRRIARVRPVTALGSPQTLAVVKAKNGWLEVVSSALPNRRIGWVREDMVGMSATTQSVTVDLSRRILVLRDGRKVVRRITVGVGRATSPTPLGRFAVTDKLSGAGYGPWYGCCIIALSARQPALPGGWVGGDRIAIHGTDRPRTIGAAASTGCIHARASDLRLLLRWLPLGAQVFIRA